MFLAEPSKASLTLSKTIMPSDLYTRFLAGLAFPLHEYLKGHSSAAVRRALEKTQWWDAERLRDLRMQRLRSLLMHADANVPYYTRLFRECGFVPGSLKEPLDLERLPLLTKGLIRTNLEDIKASNARGLVHFNTGGSSGQPLVFFVSKERISHDVAGKWRALRWWGVDIGDPEIVVWGSPIELGAQDHLRALRDRLLRSQLLPAFEMSELKLDCFIDAIRTKRPKILFGYPSALDLIARHAQRRCQPMDQLGIQVAFLTAERLYDDQRDRIRHTFGCQVANCYGGRDSGFVAHECPHGNMHITAEDIIVEIVDSGGRALPPGTEGEIVVTHLATRDFPFIRYRTGDVGTLDPGSCSCGRGLPLLREIQGRTTDFVVASDGTIMHGLALIYVMRDLPGIEAFKIIQETKLQVRVLVVKGEKYSPMVEAAIRRGIRARLGQQVLVEVEQVEDIPREQSGKFRYIVSNVAL
jgi:phenylacetate-CoA ligase